MTDGNPFLVCELWRALLETGTVEVGRRADVVVWNGDPFSVYTRPQQVWIDGALLYDTGDERYTWLNRIQSVGKGTVAGNVLTIEVCEAR